MRPLNISALTKRIEALEQSSAITTEQPPVVLVWQRQGQLVCNGVAGMDGESADALARRVSGNPSAKCFVIHLVRPSEVLTMTPREREGTP